MVGDVLDLGGVREGSMVRSQAHSPHFSLELASSSSSSLSRPLPFFSFPRTSPSPSQPSTISPPLPVASQPSEPSSESSPPPTVEP